jgi:hypothetical protein
MHAFSSTFPQGLPNAPTASMLAIPMFSTQSAAIIIIINI